MKFAHTLGESGPDIELLIVAAAMLLLGVVFFLQKAVKPVVSVVLVLGALALGAGAFALGGPAGDSSRPAASSEAVSLEIVSPADGDRVPANEPITLELDLRGADLGGADGGHFDVRIDGELETMTRAPDPEVTFEPGKHELRVEYVDLRHRSYDPPVDATVTVSAR